MKRIAFALLCSAAILCAAPRWVRVRSPNFELFTTAGEKRGREAILYFEQVRDFFLEVNRWTDTSRDPVRILAFENDEQFRPYRNNDFSPAYHLHSRGRDWIVMRGIGPQAYPVAVHEYSHVALRHAGIDVPPWLNEGLAELNSTLRPSGNRVEIGHFLPARAQVLREKKWIDVETLTAAGYDSPLYREKEQARLFYSESWALTHMLALSDAYRGGFRSFLKAVRSGAGSSAFQQVYGKPASQVQSDLAEYMARNAFPTAVFPLKFERAAEQAEVRPATELEWGMALADLLAAADNTEPARARYRDLAKQFPKEASIEEALAALELRAGRREEALLHLARAAELASTNPEAYFDYAMLLSEAGAPDAEISAPLRRATELRPDYDEAHYFLGVTLLNQNRFREGLDALARAHRVARERTSTLARAKARAHYELGDLEQAKKEAGNALEAAQNDDDRTKAAQLLEFLNQPLVTVRRVSGAFEQLECLGTAVRVWIAVNGKRLPFDVPDLEKVRIPSGEFDFPCGVQNGRPITIEYEPEGAAPRVIAIELR